MGYDVFISYPHADAAAVEPLVRALRDRGLTVWFDATAIADAQRITDAILRGLAESKVLVAWHTPAYGLSRPCQWEMTAAYLAAEQEGTLDKRLIVLAPEGHARHIQPLPLRGVRFPSTATPPDALAGVIAGQVAQIATPFRAIRAMAPASWTGFSRRTGSNRFVGRVPELWTIHSGLLASSIALISGITSDLVQVQGMGGIGKSLLAEEYALRFASAYPGGIVWLSATQAGDADEAPLSGQMAALASYWGLDTAGKDPAAVEAMVRRHLSTLPPYLWVVDDLPMGATAATLHRWQAPSGNGRTLVTTRNTRLDGNGTPVRLGILAPDEALQLLTARHPPKTDGDRAAARAIVAALGHHALAVDVAGAAVGLTGYTGFLSDLQNPGSDAMELAEELANELPNGHHPGIAVTLLQSIKRLSADGTRFLHLASLLAPEPIPKGLVTAVLAALAGNEGTGRTQALLGLKAAADEALAEMADDDTVTVHVLVSRTLRFRAPAPEPLRSAALAALKRVMVKAKDIREHGALHPLVPHARALTDPVTDAAAADLLGWLGVMNLTRGVFAAAGQDFRRQLEARKHLLGDEDPDTLTSMNNLATTLRQQGDLKGARKLHEQELSVCQRVLGDEHPDTLTSMGNLASTLWQQGDLNGARELEEQVLSVRQRVLGDEHPDTLTSMNNLAETFRHQGDLDGTRRLHEQVLSVLKRVLGDEHPDTLSSMNNLAGTLWQQGDLGGARELHEQVLSVSRRVLGDEHPDTLSSMSNLAVTQWAQGERRDARALLNQALPVILRTQGGNHPLAKTIRRLLAQMDEAEGCPPDTEPESAP